MSIIDRHTNWLYSGTVPAGLLDRLSAQDLIRDYYSNISRIGKSLSSILGIEQNTLINGGVVSKGTGDTVNITKLRAFIKQSVEVPDDFTLVPPSKQTVDVFQVTDVPANLTNRPVTGGQIDSNLYANATLDGSTVNYVKIKFIEIDAGTRNKKEDPGSWVYQKEPSYEIRIEPVAPTAYEVELTRFTGTAGGAFTFDTTALSGYRILQDRVTIADLISKFIKSPLTLGAAKSAAIGEFMVMLNGTIQKGDQKLNREIISGIMPGSSYPSTISHVEILDDERIIIIYYDGSDTQAKLMVSKCVDNLWTHGTPIVISANTPSFLSATAMSSTEILITHANSTNGTEIKLYSVADTVLTLEDTYAWSVLSVANDIKKIDTNKAVLVYRDGSGGLSGVVITISGATISAGSNYTISTGITIDPNAQPAISIDSTSRFVSIVSRVGGDCDIIYCTTISGTVMTTHDNIIPYTLTTSGTPRLGITKLKNAFFAFSVGQSTGLLIGQVELTEANLFSRSDAKLLSSQSVNCMSISKVNYNKILLTIRNNGLTTPALISYYIDINSWKIIDSIEITSDAPTLLYTDFSVFFQNEVLILCRDNSTLGQLIKIYKPKPVGIASESGTAIEIDVIISGTSNVHSGLNIGSDVYNDNGDLNQLGKGYRIGHAISATEIVLTPEEWWVE